MYAVIGRDSHVVRPGVQHVEGCVRLGQKMVPLVDRKVGMRTNEDREKVVSKRLDRAFGLVCALLVGQYALDDDLLLPEEPHKRFGAYVVEDLKTELMAEVLEELIRALECGMGEAQHGELFQCGMGEARHGCRTAVKSGDREASGKIGEQGLSAELG